MTTDNKDLVFTIRSSTAHRFAKDPLGTFEDAISSDRKLSATPSMLVGTFMHTLLFGSDTKSFTPSDKVTARIKLKELVDGCEIYEVKTPLYNLCHELVQKFIKALNAIPLAKEIFFNGTTEKTLYASKDDYFKTMGLELKLDDKNVLIHGTPDLFYIKDDILYLVDFKTTSTLDRKLWFYSIGRYGYMSQLIHYRTLIEINTGRKFKDVVFMHWVQSTSGINKGFWILENNKFHEDRFIEDNASMCSMINTYGLNLLEYYVFTLERLNIDQTPEEEKFDDEDNEEEFESVIY